MKDKPVQIGAITQAQKWQMDFEVSSIPFYSNRKTQNSTELAPSFGFFNIHSAKCQKI